MTELRAFGGKVYRSLPARFNQSKAQQAAKHQRTEGRRARVVRGPRRSVYGPHWLVFWR